MISVYELIIKRTWLYAAASERVDFDGVDVEDCYVAGAHSIRLVRKLTDHGWTRYLHVRRERHVTEVYLRQNSVK